MFNRNKNYNNQLKTWLINNETNKFNICKVNCFIRNNS